MARACLKCGHENPDDVDFGALAGAIPERIVAAWLDALSMPTVRTTSTPMTKSDMSISRT